MNINMSEEAKEALVKSEGFKNLIQRRHDFNELMNHEGYKVLMDWVSVQIKCFEHEAIHGKTAQYRDEQRIYALALYDFCNMPLFLGQLLQDEVSSGVAS